MGLTTRAVLILELALTVALLTTAQALTSALAQWVPSESYAGGRQDDPRLDKPVSFWRAGMPLADVFQQVEEQTGVAIGFIPEGDINARICVNLYLNPDQPPTLREVLAQLSWALGCAFGYDDQNGDIRYALLGTSLGSGDVVAKLEAQERAESEAEFARRSLPREEVLKRQEDLRDALSLSREEATRKYQGDYLLLLAVLDPARRATAELFVSQPLQFGQERPVFVLPHQKLSSLPPGLRSAALETVRPALMRWLKRVAGTAQAPEIKDDPVAWLASLDPMVNATLVPGASQGEAYVGGEAEVPGRQGLMLPLEDLKVAGEGDPQDEIAARRLLGETVSSEEEAKIRDDYLRRYLIEHKEPSENAQARARREPIPEEMEQLLNSLRLPVDLGEHALWQIQELVAKTAGLNIVSDSFWQPQRDMRILYEAPGADRDAETTALMALKAVTGRTEQGLLAASGAFGGGVSPYSTAWEWHGAGRFLAFRSLERDLWRAAFLPTEAVETLDRWVEPYLPAPGVREAPTVTPDWRAFGRLISDLSVAQLRWGGLLTYGDPTDFRSACRGSFRERMLDQAGGWQGPVETLRLLGLLSEEQWRQLRAGGIRIGGDIALATVQECFRPRAHGVRGGYSVENAQLLGTVPGAGFAEGDVLRLQGGQTERDEWEESQPTLELCVLRGGQRIGRFVLPTRLALWPRPTESIAIPAS